MSYLLQLRLLRLLIVGRLRGLPVQLLRRELHLPSQHFFHAMPSNHFLYSFPRTFKLNSAFSSPDIVPLVPLEGKLGRG